MGVRSERQRLKNFYRTNFGKFKGKLSYGIITYSQAVLYLLPCPQLQKRRSRREKDARRCCRTTPTRQKSHPTLAVSIYRKANCHHSRESTLPGRGWAATTKAATAQVESCVCAAVWYPANICSTFLGRLCLPKDSYIRGIILL